MNCLYCGILVAESKEYPYPYIRVGKRHTKGLEPLKPLPIQTIRKYMCPVCDKPSFWEERNNVDGNMHVQEYKYGHYKFIQGMQ